MKQIEAIQHNGRSYLRLTSVLSCFRFPDDYSDGGDEKAMRAAGRIGDQVHRRIVGKVLGKKVALPKSFEAATAWDNWLDWEKQNEGWSLAAVLEQRYFDDELGVTWQVDCHDGELLRDWKTSARLMTRHWVQVNTYAGLLRRQRVPIRQVELVRLDRNQRLWDQQTQEFDESLMDWAVSLIRLVQRMYLTTEKIGVSDDTSVTDTADSGE